MLVPDQVPKETGPSTEREPAGLRAIFLQHRALLRRFVLARGAQDPEDLLQDLWMKIHSANAPVADPLGYIMRAAQNLIIDRSRAEAQRRRREERWSQVAIESEPGAFDWSSERTIIARESLQQAEAALARLPAKTKEIFYHYRLDGLSRKQIADELGISVSAVEKHLKKAYRHLLDVSRDWDQ